MTIQIQGLSFDGPYTNTSSLKNQSGVYVILTPSNNNNYSVLDVGESNNVKERVENHDRATCWTRNANNGRILYSAYYTSGYSEDQRRNLEAVIRNQNNPPCGER